MAPRRGSDRDHLRAGVALALLLHGAAALAVALLPEQPGRGRQVVEVDIRRREPPPVAPATPPEPPPPEPERKIVKKERRAEAPRPTKPAEPPPLEPPVPAFGLSDKDTAPGGSMTVPLGNTTMADPSKRPRGPAAPLPPSDAPGGREYRPVAESELRRQPDHDGESCGASMREKYSTSQAYAEGIEGEVVFRIELDEQGKIHGIKKLKGLGRGLDEMAMGFLRFNPKCRFGPAIGKDGRPAPFVIERYSVIFEAQR